MFSFAARCIQRQRKTINDKKKLYGNQALELNATMFLWQQTNRCQKIFRPRSVKYYQNALNLARFFVLNILSQLLATATSLCTTIESSCTTFFLQLISTLAIIVNHEMRAVASSRTTLIVQFLRLLQHLTTILDQP